MNRYRTILLSMLVLALIQLACAMPVVGSQQATPTLAATATSMFPTLEPTATLGPVVVTATPAGENPTATQAPAAATATTAPSTGNNTGNNTSTSCTYRATFISDVTIPDDTVVAAGASFTKTWRVRNDGTCTWGPNAKLHALAFTGGSKLNGPDQVNLPGEVKSGQSVDVSVNLTAPTAAGTYTSEWKFRVDGDPNYTNTYVGLGADRAHPLFARIKVGSAASTATRTPTGQAPTATPVSSSRISFAAGGTAGVVTGDVKANQSKSFLVAASRNQTLMAALSGAASDAKVSLAAKDGSALTVYTSPDGKNANAWLPVNGDYIITVKAGASDTAFTLTATIPVRITFASDASSAKVDGKISAKLPNTYFLKASKDQTMTVTAVSSGDVVRLTIYGLQDGKVLVSSGDGKTTWTGKLPMTQDYVIVAVPTVDSANFTLETTVK